MIDVDYFYLAVSVNGKGRVGGPEIETENYLHANSWRIISKGGGQDSP